MVRPTIWRLLSFAILSIFSLPGYSGTQNPATTSVHLYNWWNYLEPAVSERLATSGYQTELTVYRGNEEALSRLVAGQHDFDVAIVSNFALPYLMERGLIETNKFRHTAKKRNYLTTFNDTAPHCLPYFWSTTVFVADERVTPKLPGTLQELVALKQQGYKIGVVDDLYEVAARLIGDSKTLCGKSTVNYVENNPFGILSSCSGGESLPKIGLAKEDFISSAAELLSQPKMAFYGWQGTALTYLPKYPKLKVNIPTTRPVVGYDAVCIIKNRTRKIPTATLTHYVEMLTDKRSTELNMLGNQYFSPYKNHTTGLQPTTRKLYEELTERLTQEKPIIIRQPTFSDQLRMNEWWTAIRYAP